MESSCIDDLQRTQRNLCILRLVGPDLRPTITSYLTKTKKLFVARRIASKLMLMGYILPSRWQSVYNKAARIDTCPALVQNIDAILSMLFFIDDNDDNVNELFDHWHYKLSL